MNTTWKFTDLASIADHLENKAREQRASAERFKAKSLRRVDFIARAAENESVAYLLRHTELTA